MFQNLIMKIKTRKVLILQVLLFGMFPLICALIYCLKDGHLIGETYLPMSYWNDELMYYKQVESIVFGGLAKGWFGFNEAHGAVFPFAAWSPVILIPWCIWGSIFGWSLTTPIYFNIVCSMLSMGAFACLVKPDKKQSAWILGLMAAFVPYTRYMLSGMPETLCMSLGILFVGLSISYIREEKLWKINCLFGIAAFLMLSRPYLGLLLLLPLWFMWKRFSYKGGLIGLAIIGVTTIGYGLVAKTCNSPYIEPIVETEWLSIFKTDGFIQGIQYIVSTLVYKFSYLFDFFLKRAVKYGLISGALYAMVGILAVFLLVKIFCAWKKKRDDDYIICYLHLFISIVGMVLALFLFYRMGEGAKHLMIFIVMGLLLLTVMKKDAWAMKLLAMLLCIYFFVIKAIAPYDWQVPFDDSKMLVEATSLSEQLQNNLILEETEDKYKNTVIWLASDVIKEESIPATWGLLYMVPEGFGLNFCTQAYVMENFEQLQSRYIALLPDGDVEARVMESGASLIAETDRMKVYQINE